eukprot:m.179830 g.179830  ORF g.179830 m.179830 type:complete len:94 (+) comp14649_c0_seq9:73-354(+)
MEGRCTAVTQTHHIKTHSLFALAHGSFMHMFSLVSFAIHPLSISSRCTTTTLSVTPWTSSPPCGSHHTKTVKPSHQAAKDRARAQSYQVQSIS